MAARTVPPRLWTAACILVLSAGTVGAKNDLKTSAHNLSASGAGRMRSVGESEICIFCHNSHGGTPEAPLWNRYSSGAVYIPYDSTTSKAKTGQPTGSSKLCLSCHDGTIALGTLRNRSSEVHMLAGIGRMPSGRSNLGTDLSDDHPISFRYDRGLVSRSVGGLKDPATLRKEVRLDHDGQVQCTTCHDAHSDRYGNFLVVDNRQSALCLTCHDPRYWESSAHRSDASRWNGKSLDPWPHTDHETVAENGCSSCHASHGAGTHQRLLVQPNEEDNCLSCHNGNVAKKDISRDLQKKSAHNVTKWTGVHDPTEDPVRAPIHVECADCHNAHAATDGDARAPQAPGSLAGVNGINASGSLVQPLTKEYELCFRCHADGENRMPSTVPRQNPQPNTRLAFAPGNASYHPVVEAGRNAEVPSLVQGYRPSSLIYCTDCHNSDQGPGAGGSGANGPHGSIWEPLLERQLVIRDGQAESPAAYALCYKCHERASVLGDQSFPFHALHVRDGKTACTTCHDSHGSAQNAHLINFNRDYVTPNSEGRLQFEDLGSLSGQCNLSCHGKDHIDVKYPDAKRLFLPRLRRTK